MHVFDTGVAEYFRARDECILCELVHPGRTDEPDIMSLNCSLVHAIVKPGDRTLPHRLIGTSEIYYIISGKGMMYIEGESSPVSGGMAVVIPPGAIQNIVNTGNGNLEFIAVCDPAWRQEDEEILADSQEDI